MHFPLKREDNVATFIPRGKTENSEVTMYAFYCVIISFLARKLLILPLKAKTTKSNIIVLNSAYHRVARGMES